MLAEWILFGEEPLRVPFVDYGHASATRRVVLGEFATR
jgi:hypothetical protein